MYEVVESTRFIHSATRTSHKEELFTKHLKEKSYKFHKVMQKAENWHFMKARLNFLTI